MDHLQLHELKSIKVRTPLIAKLFNWVAAYPWFVTWQTHYIDLSIVLLCTIESLPLLAIGSFIGHTVKKRNQKRRDDLAKVVLQEVESGTSVAYFLYLRPFTVTGLMHNAKVMPFDMNPIPDLEERLANSLTDFGPLVSLGKELEAYGSSRVLTSEELWKETALFLLNTAKVIFMVPGYQDGTKWEMEQIVNNGYLSKTVFIIPAGSLKKHWKMTSDTWKKSFGIVLPKYHEERLFLVGRDLFTYDLCFLRDMEKPNGTEEILRRIE